MKNYDVVIVGAGPAGLFATYYILNYTKNIRVLLVDKGLDIEERKCSKECISCSCKDNCSIICGIGGAGLYSDGKLVVDLNSGGILNSISSLSIQDMQRLSKYIVRVLRDFDGFSEDGPPISPEEKECWKNIFNRNDLNIKHYDVVHIGTENLNRVCRNFVSLLKEYSSLTIRSQCEIIDTLDNGDGTTTLCTRNGEKIKTNYVIFSVGKSGSAWIKNVFRKNSINLKNTKSYVGVRVEVAHELIKDLFNFSLDPKIWSIIDGKKVKTHCFCRQGDVIKLKYMENHIVGGHTRFTKNNNVSSNKISNKSNFNILVETEKNEEDIVKMLNKFKAINCFGIVKQRLYDFIYSSDNNSICSGSTSEYEYGNIRDILDEFDDIGIVISDFLLKLQAIIPGVISEENSVYAPSIEWIMDTVNVDCNMETSHDGWFAVGDGAGISQGIVHAAATGVIAANEICLRLNRM